MPVAPDAEWIGAGAPRCRCCPAERRRRLADAAGVEPRRGAVVVAVERGLDDLALAAIDAGGDPARVLVHVEHNLAVEGAAALAPAPSPRSRAWRSAGELTATQAKAVLAELRRRVGGADRRPSPPRKGFEAMDTGALDAAVDEAIAAHPAEWERYRAGDDKAAASSPASSSAR